MTIAATLPILKLDSVSSMGEDTNLVISKHDPSQSDETVTLTINTSEGVRATVVVSGDDLLEAVTRVAQPLT
jgi:hypothetical protein